jgi:hypothetical protein
MIDAFIVDKKKNGFWLEKHCIANECKSATEEIALMKSLAATNDRVSVLCHHDTPTGRVNMVRVIYQEGAWKHIES